MRTLLRTGTFALQLCLAFSLGLVAACDDKETASPADSEKKEKSGNLCTEYSTCDECIAGQQGKGKSLGEAETQCGAAVTGCFVTWDKPITCNGKAAEGGE